MAMLHSSVKIQKQTTPAPSGFAKSLLYTPPQNQIYCYTFKSKFSDDKRLEIYALYAYYK